MEFSKCFHLRFLKTFYLGLLQEFHLGAPPRIPLGVSFGILPVCLGIPPKVRSRDPPGDPSSFFFVIASGVPSKDPPGIDSGVLPGIPLGIPSEITQRVSP